MGRRENKGRCVGLLKSWLGKAVTGYRLGRVPREKSGIVLGGSAYHWIAWRSFQMSNRLCFTIFCACIFECVKAVTHIYYKKTAIQELHSNTMFPLFEKKKANRHLVIYWLQAKFKYNSIMIKRTINNRAWDLNKLIMVCHFWIAA